MTTDRAFLRDQQYRDDTNLNARAALHRRFSVSPQGFTRWLFDALDPPPDARILDVGCGPGFLWRANADRVPGGWEVLLSDFSPGMVRAAREALGAGRFRYELADAAALPHPPGTFDAVVANHMLYRVPDRPRAIAELARVLRPDGALYAATNGTGHLREIGDLVARHGSGLRGEHHAAAFGLENGASQLGTAFATVELRLRENQLEVTDPDAVAAYVLSMVPRERVDVDAIRREVAGVIGREGSLRVETASGLFIARTPIQSSP